MVIELRLAVRGGDLETIGRLLAERPGLARARFVGRQEGTGTLLHFAADWPGHFPHGAEMVRLIVSAGADPSAPATGGDILLGALREAAVFLARAADPAAARDQVGAVLNRIIESVAG